MAANANAATADQLEDNEGAEAASQPQRRKLFGLLPIPSLKWLIIGAAGLVVVVGGAGAAFYAFRAPSETKVATVPGKPAVFVDLPEVLVNLATPGSDRTHYLKVRIVLELPDQQMIAQIQPVMPRVLDAFQTYLRELRPSDLEGSAGLYRLKEELTRRINLSIAPSRITAVLFKEIVVQ